MFKNPLTTTVILFVCTDLYSAWEAITEGGLSVFTVILWLQGIILLILYLKKSRFAGSYLFYSIIPVFPIYVGLDLSGLDPTPATSEVYAFLFVIYVVGIALLWKVKRDYDRYMTASIQPAAVVKQPL